MATSTFDYDGIGRLTDLTHTHDSSLLTDYDWTFDPASRIATQTIDRPGTTADESSVYDYNQNDELTSADHTGVTLPDEQLEYDLNGNRTQGSYDAGEYNRIATDAEGNAYTYDAEGNIIRKVAVGGAVTVFSWDHRNRLVAVDEFANETDADADTNATSLVEHKYDALDRWVETSHDTDGDASGTAEVTRFAYDGTQIIYQLDGATGDIENRYLWGPAVDMLLADEQIDGANVDTYWALTDHLGSVRELIDDDGNVELRRQFDAFGNMVETLNPNGIDELFAYTGRPYDEATGLQNNWHRWYDSEIGRWVSEDPIGFAGGDTNIARYVGNSPTYLIDSLGTAEEFSPLVWNNATHQVIIDATGTSEGDISAADKYLAEKFPDFKTSKNVGGTWHHAKFNKKTGKMTLVLVDSVKHATTKHVGAMAAYLDWVAEVLRDKKSCANLTDDQATRILRTLANKKLSQRIDGRLADTGIEIIQQVLKNRGHKVVISEGGEVIVEIVGKRVKRKLFGTVVTRVAGKSVGIITVFWAAGSAYAETGEISKACEAGARDAVFADVVELGFEHALIPVSEELGDYLINPSAHANRLTRGLSPQEREQFMRDFRESLNRERHSIMDSPAVKEAEKKPLGPQMWEALKSLFQDL